MRDAVIELRQGGVPDPQRDARVLWRAACPNRTSDFGAQGEAQIGRFKTLVERRAAREPMSHLLGYRDFYDHRFEVGPEALDPRPDTEALIAAALERPFERVLDLGTGTGCILLSLLAKRPDAAGVGVDLSADALTLAQRNVARLEQAVRPDRVTLIQSDWFSGVSGDFDLIVSNPPYIAAAEMADLAPELSHEPRIALTDDGDGLSCYRIICAGAPAYLRPKAWLMVEIGPTQATAVSAMMADAGLDQIGIRPDLDGRDRVILGQMPQKAA